MVFYEISGDIEVSIYGACDKKISGKLASAIKRTVYEIVSKHGSFEIDNIQVNTDNLEYEKEED